MFLASNNKTQLRILFFVYLGRKPEGSGLRIVWHPSNARKGPDYLFCCFPIHRVLPCCPLFCLECSYDGCCDPSTTSSPSFSMPESRKISAGANKGGSALTSYISNEKKMTCCLAWCKLGRV